MNKPVRTKRRYVSRCKGDTGTPGITDPLVITLADQVLLCSDELDAWLGREVGCATCPVKEKCYHVWEKEVVNRFSANLRAHELAGISKKLEAVRLERNILLGIDGQARVQC